jgi:hypothetical protein
MVERKETGRRMAEVEGWKVYLSPHSHTYGGCRRTYTSSEWFAVDFVMCGRIAASCDLLGYHHRAI